MTKLKSAANRRYFSKHWQLYSMLLIMFITLLIFNYWPMTGLQLAFKDWRIPIGNQAGGIWGSPWATDELGNLDLLKHFKTLFTNPKVYPTFFNTLRISLLRLVCGFPMPILLALFLNELTSDKFRKTVQSISYLPYFISWVIIANILKDLTASQSALQNLLSSLCGHEDDFFGNGNLFIGLLIVSDIWKNVGWGTIIYFAALTGIGPELYEAGMVDGANRWQTLWRVTIPNVMPSITICMFLSLTNGFKLFDQNLALTAGRPFQQLGNGETIKTTEMLALNIVNAFGTNGGGNRGAGQAKAVIFFIVVAAISIIQLQASRRKEVQQ